MGSDARNSTELRELLDQIAEVLEDGDASAEEKLTEVEAILFGDEDEEE